VLHGELYEADDLGYNLHREREFEVPPGLEDAATQGARDCPERAITTAIENSPPRDGGQG
jgi:ferredoxin